MRVLYPGRIEIRSVVGFCRGRNTREPSENPSEQRENQQTQSTGHFSGEQAISPLRHRCAPLEKKRSLEKHTNEKKNHMFVTYVTRLHVMKS